MNDDQKKALVLADEYERLIDEVEALRYRDFKYRLNGALLRKRRKAEEIDTFLAKVDRPLPLTSS